MLWATERTGVAGDYEESLAKDPCFGEAPRRGLHRSVDAVLAQSEAAQVERYRRALDEACVEVP